MALKEEPDRKLLQLREVHSKEMSKLLEMEERKEENRSQMLKNLHKNETPHSEGMR